MDNSNRGQGRTGIHNQGNFCYVNAFLQCLAHTDPFRIFILTSVNQEVLDTAGTHPVQYQLAFAIHMAITQMWSNNYASIRLDAYRNAIIRYADTFGQSHAAQLLRTNGQQDTHELIVFLMDLLHECYKRPCVVPYEKQREDSIIKDQFRFFSVTEFVCGTENCGNTKFGECEEMTHLQIELPDPKWEVGVNPYQCVLQKRLEYYFRREGYIYEVTCPKCKQKAIDEGKYIRREERAEKDKTEKEKLERRKCRRPKSSKQIRLCTLPKILMIQLKRFKWSQIGDKNNCIVYFPIKGLDMQNYLSPIGHDHPAQASSRGKLNNTVYDLYAVINHEGVLNSGHYTAYAKPSHDSKPGLGWRHFNDQVVTPFDPRQFESVLERQQQAYILFYRLKDA